jgi:prepilin-type N-terminal cleavage/methylation domain-containing protein
VRHNQSGFALIEIAVVLVIIGLLLGGVLKGQELITQAKIRNVINDFNGLATAVYAYQLISIATKHCREMILMPARGGP